LEATKKKKEKRKKKKKKEERKRKKRKEKKKKKKKFEARLPLCFGLSSRSRRVLSCFSPSQAG
jgi:hypothetical protein